MRLLGDPFRQRLDHPVQRGGFGHYRSLDIRKLLEGLYLPLEEYLPVPVSVVEPKGCRYPGAFPNDQTHVVVFERPRLEARYGPLKHEVGPGGIVHHRKPPVRGQKLADADDELSPRVSGLRGASELTHQYPVGFTGNDGFPADSPEHLPHGSSRGRGARNEDGQHRQEAQCRPHQSFSRRHAGFF